MLASRGSDGVAVRSRKRVKIRKGASKTRRRSGPTPRLLRPVRLLKPIQDALSVDLLHPNYAASPNQLYYGCVGHCYIATEAAYHLFARNRGFVSYTRRNDNGTTHWWLYNERTGRILDPSEPQLDGDPYPYDEGHRQAFLTKRPSRRAAELIRRVKSASR